MVSGAANSAGRPQQDHCIQGLDLHVSFGPVRHCVGELGRCTSDLKRDAHKVHNALPDPAPPGDIDPHASLDQIVSSLEGISRKIGGFRAQPPQDEPDCAAVARERSAKRKEQWRIAATRPHTSRLMAGKADDSTELTGKALANNQRRAFVHGNSVLDSTVLLPDELLGTLVGNKLEPFKSDSQTVAEQWANSLYVSRRDYTQADRSDNNQPPQLGSQVDGAVCRGSRILRRAASHHAIYRAEDSGQGQASYESGRRLGHADWPHAMVGSVRHSTYHAVQKQRRPRRTDALAFEAPAPQHTKHPMDHPDSITSTWGAEYLEHGDRKDHRAVYAHAYSAKVESSRTAMDPALLFKIRSRMRASSYTGRRGMELDVLFKRMDDDGNGTLDVEELRSALRKVFGVPKSTITDEQVDEFFEWLDTDGSGQIESSELVDFLTTDRAKKEQEERAAAYASADDESEQGKAGVTRSERLRMMQDKFECKRIQDRIAWLEHDHVVQRSPRRPPIPLTRHLGDDAKGEEESGTRPASPRKSLPRKGPVSIKSFATSVLCAKRLAGGDAQSCAELNGH